MKITGAGRPPSLIATSAAPPSAAPTGPTLWAVSDLHIQYLANREVAAAITADHPGDWLIVAGDIGDPEDIDWLWSQLRPRFAGIGWVPGNHDLWVRSSSSTPDSEQRYRELVELARRHGVLTPDDPWPVLETDQGPRHLVLLLTLYDYSFLPPGQLDAPTALRSARDRGIVFTDEFLLRPGPYGTVDAWCRQRVAGSAARLDRLGPADRTILVNHYPLTDRPIGWYREPALGLWSGTRATQRWPWDYRASAVVYGHQHIPHHYREDGVDFHEVSLGYPRERGSRTWHPRAICPLLS